MLIGMSFLSGCAPASYSMVCPSYPIAGSHVADELESAGNLPATWEWIGRLDKLRQELELCH